MSGHLDDVQKSFNVGSNIPRELKSENRCCVSWRQKRETHRASHAHRQTDRTLSYDSVIV